MCIFKFAVLWNSERWSAVPKQFFLLRHLSLCESSSDINNLFKLVTQLCICMHQALTREFSFNYICTFKSSTFNKQWIWLKPTVFLWWKWGKFSGYADITSLIHNFQNQWRCSTYTSTCRVSLSSAELSACAWCGNVVRKQHGANLGFGRPIRAQRILYITRFKDTSHLSHHTSLKKAELY